MGNPLIEVQKYGQSIWYDNISRGLVLSGGLHRMVEQDGLLGVTSNPAIFEKAMAGSDDYLPATRALVAQGVHDPSEIFEHLAIQDIQMAADVLYPAWRRTAKRDGYVSLEVSPHLANDTQGTLEDARRLWSEVGRENLMIKVPATPAGVPAIEQLLAEGINVNVTLLFAVAAYADVAEAWLRGLERRAERGQALDHVASVASFFVSRIDALVDGKIEAAGDPSLAPLLGRIAIANARLAYAHFRDVLASDRWQALAAKGAQSQRVLWASTSTKNPSYPKTLYVDELVGADTVNTLPGDTFEAFRDEGTARDVLGTGFDAQLAEASEQIARLEAAGISLDESTDQLLTEGVRKFVEPFDSLLATIERRRGEISGR
ncbi:MAG TPA: transaldolase [Myxococcota bacterium]|nr:transaldolase [Myxococcota bacterium]